MRKTTSHSSSLISNAERVNRERYNDMFSKNSIRNSLKKSNLPKAFGRSKALAISTLPAETLPLVSVLVVNYNGKEYLEKCLHSILSCEYQNIEIIVVDNGSKDGSDSVLNNFERENSHFHTIFLDKNYGPAYARNRGVELAKGKYIAFLDNDTEPTRDWLIESVKVMESNSKIGACQCKLLLLMDKQKFDYAGDYLSQFGFLIQKADFNEVDHGQYDYVDEVLSAKSAAMVILKKVFVEVGGFDEDYFMYLEETDLCWRVWLNGYRVVFIPLSIVYHAFAGSSKIDANIEYRSWYHGSKNYVMTLIKDLGAIDLLRILPLHIILWVGMVIFFFSRRKWKKGIYIVDGLLYCFFHFRELTRKRRRLQRKVMSSNIEKSIMRKASIKYFLYKFRRGRI